jgi:hypothetical protein
MGLLKDIGRVLIGGALGGPLGALTAFQIGHGSDVVEGTLDWVKQIVTIGEDTYTALNNPIAGILKHTFKDEFILVGRVAGVVGLFGAWPLAAIGAVGFSRPLNDQEWEMAQYIFHDSLEERSDIVLTTLGGIGGRAFTVPLAPDGHTVLVNLGDDYSHESTIKNGALLYHELTHVWQARQRTLTSIYLYDTIPEAAANEYSFQTDGRQWSEYGTEQQAGIVEAWTLGATKNPFDRGARKQCAIGSPLFRYINGNVRLSDNGATTGSGQSVRQLLADGGHRAVRDMHSNPPPLWWS